METETNISPYAHYILMIVSLAGKREFVLFQNMECSAFHLEELINYLGVGVSSSATAYAPSYNSLALEVAQQARKTGMTLS